MEDAQAGRHSKPVWDKGLEAACQPRDHTESEWQELCTTTEQELLKRGCAQYTTTAAELLDRYNIKQSFRVKDYYKDGSARPYQCLRWATVAGETLKHYRRIARRLCDRWQATQPQERSTGQADHGRPEGGAQTQKGQHGAGATGNVQQGGEQDHMEQSSKRRRTSGMSRSEVNKIDSVRKLFDKTVAALINFQHPRNQQVAKWVINAKVLQVEKRLYPHHSGESYVTFFDRTTKPLKGLVHAATKLAELADREAAQEPPFHWTAAQKQLPLYPVLNEVHPSLDHVMSADPRQTHEESMGRGADSSAAAGADPASTPPQQQEAPDRAEWQPELKPLQAETKELRSRMDKLKAELVAAQQERDTLQAGLPDEEESAGTLETLMEEAEQAEATWKQKCLEWKKVKQEADDAELVLNNIKQRADGVEARRSQAAALAAKVAELERLQEAKDTTERQLATAHQSVLSFF